MAQKELQMLTIDQWIKKSTVAPLSTRIVFGILALLSFFLFLFFLKKELDWEHKVKTWDKVQGTILFNGKTVQKSGRRRKTVSLVEYTYMYKGKIFRGNRIAYDSSTFPEKVKAGSRGVILVNPDSPAQSAAMVTYKGYWFLIRYNMAFFLFCLFLFLGGMVLYFFKKHPPELPENLLSYLKSFSPEKLNALPVLKRPFSVKSNLYMDFPAQEVEEGILLIKSKKGIWGILMILFFLFFFTAAAVILQKPIIFIYTVFFVILLYIYFKFPVVLVIDFHEKCLYRCKEYTPEKMPQVKKITFEEVDFLSLQSFPEMNEYLLCAVHLNGSMVPLFKIRGKNLSSYGEILVTIAEKMGTLPVILR